MVKIQWTGFTMECETNSYSVYFDSDNEILDINPLDGSCGCLSLKVEELYELMEIIEEMINS